MTDKVELSAVVPVEHLFEASGNLARQYIAMLEKTGKSFELVYVLDGEHRDLLTRLLEIAENDERLRILQLAKSFGEASALTAGFEHTSGDTILTLPAYAQVEIADIPKLLDELEQCDFAAAVRIPGNESAAKWSIGRRNAFHWLVKFATGMSFNDMGCGVRAFKRAVVNELPLYGDQYRFFALLVSRRGFRVRELPLRQAVDGGVLGRHGAKTYLARVLDIFALVILTRFFRKPLRFFGAFGTAVFALGAVIVTLLVVQRLFFGVALVDRPALLLSSLMVVLGLQVFALGLLGELIIFTHARDMQEYTIERIVN